MDTATKPIITTTSLSFLLHVAAVAGALLVYQQVSREDTAVGQGVDIQLISSVLVSDHEEADVARKQEVTRQAPSENLMRAAEKRFAEDILTSVNNTAAVVTSDPVEKQAVDKNIAEQQLDTRLDHSQTHETEGLAYASQATSASQQQHSILELLHRRISDNKEYPYLARRQRREGTATVAFVLHPDGRIENTHLVSSSHAVALDRAALTAVEQIEPFAVAKEYLQESKTFQVDIEFDLL